MATDAMSREKRRFWSLTAPVAATLALLVGALPLVQKVWADPSPVVTSPGPEQRPYTTTIEVAEDGNGIRAAVAAASLLVSLEQDPVDSPATLLRRAREDEQRITRALLALGYFSARVLTSVNGVLSGDADAEDELSAVPQPEKLAAVIQVIPGRLFVLGDVSIQTRGGGASVSHATLTMDAIGLRPGDPAISANIVAANGRAIEILREQGFAFARLESRQATADHATAKLDLALQYDPGQMARMGPVTIDGVEKVNPAFVAGLAPFTPGDPFTSSRLKDFKDTLERLNVFDSVVISEASTLDEELHLPLTVTVHERPRRAVGVAASWSTREGAALSSYWEHRNLLGEAERLRIEASSSRLFLNAVEDYEYVLRTSLTLPAWPERRDDVRFSINLKRERPDAYARNAVELGVGWTRLFDKSLRLEAGLLVAQAREEDIFGTQDRTTLSLPVALLYDTRNDPLEPVVGFRASAELRPLLDLRRAETAAARLLLQGAAYTRLDTDARTVLAGRISAGLSLGADVGDLPADLRFFAGGGGSVRGYAFQGLGPRDPQDRIIGGASLAEASVELRHWVWDDIGAAAFVDTGAAFAAEIPDFSNLGTGAGVGIRYRTPIGPLRLDVAIPLDPRASDPDFSVYVGLGQAF